MVLCMLFVKNRASNFFEALWGLITIEVHYNFMSFQFGFPFTILVVQRGYSASTYWFCLDQKFWFSGKGERYIDRDKGGVMSFKNKHLSLLNRCID